MIIILAIGGLFAGLSGFGGFELSGLDDGGAYLLELLGVGGCCGESLFLSVVKLDSGQRIGLGCGSSGCCRGFLGLGGCLGGGYLGLFLGLQLGYLLGCGLGLLLLG